mmetsp:Transcript_23365/g.41331  ORF Transcript_23365/g.41331 Transcript_23365/m.41331 type:complete len:210 (+) Transcript_23365:70-699(+)|eukprot:CAMPEP_0184524232 /NCGR_PEP_ID=MMETSP0198_2-20121128/9383_1 /TAXON_ID=1112570 /ORGANISM="Thraustochytrium sp., Strain LLF1b" /LENGTH=209 /DNA_ID=CAMNT_0026915467 /DNA_START=54 /DNA_END=683 /DNA_ORIENTATION=+
MGLNRNTMSKRSKTGANRVSIRKKRKYQMARPPAMTKLGAKRVHPVRVMGGARKFRALRLDTGNFSWGTEVCTRKVRIVDVTYNASNNELLRTKTLVKNCIVQIDATPFRQWYESHYGVEIANKRATKKDEEVKEDVKKSKHVMSKLKQRQKNRVLDPAIEEQLSSGRLYACVSSRPGQSGRCDGYILEGAELAFYKKMMDKKKGKKKE